MVRRSDRLQEGGYYTEDGTPTVSYKETIYWVFRKRRRPGGGRHQIDSGHCQESVFNEQRPQTMTTTDRRKTTITTDHTRSVTTTVKTQNIFTVDGTRYMNETEQTTIKTTDRTRRINPTDGTSGISTGNLFRCLLLLLLLVVGK